MWNSHSGSNSQRGSVAGSVPAATPMGASSDDSKSEGKATVPLLNTVPPAPIGPTTLFGNPMASPSGSSPEAPQPVAPSRTVDYIRCPRLSVLSRRWQPRREWKPHLEAGHAIHAALQAYLCGVEDPEVRLFDVLKQGWPGDEQGFDSTWVDARRGWRKLRAHWETYYEGWKVIACELCLDHPQCGKPTPGVCAIVDLVVERPDGGIVIIDLKTKLQGDPRWDAKDIEAVAPDWQTKDYAWRWWRNTGVVPVERKRVLVICNGPARVLDQGCDFDSDQMFEWLTVAEWTWWLYSQGPAAAMNMPNFTSCQDYGRCPMYDACHVLRLKNLETLYDKVVE